VAALGHDIEHTGRTNAFEVSSASKLAIRYHDVSVLEQHHAAKTFLILQREQSNILAALSDEERKLSRKMIIEAILGTDMSKHFSMITAMG
jgi:hypothetical protein